jgi:hypothetical protein
MLEAWLHYSKRPEPVFGGIGPEQVTEWGFETERFRESAAGW